MKYKVGDRVRIKSLDWYYENKSKRDNISFPYEAEVVFTSEMSSFCGQIVTISQKGYTQDVGFYRIREDNDVHMWIDEMIEGLVEEETCIGINIYKDGYIHGGNVVGNEITLPQGYQFVDENGNVINARKIVLEKNEKEYPKTYEECCKVLNTTPQERFQFDFEPYGEELYNLHRLLVCRDAYWKLYGDEIGLGKPWKPNDSSGYCTYAILRHTGHIRKSRPYADSELLEFPTEEMRDAFYENFKEEIESCKELL